MKNIWNAVKYFFLLPLSSLAPPPLPYLLARRLSRLEYRFDGTRRNAVRQGIVHLLPDDPPRDEALSAIVRQYFEVIACDELDAYLYLSWFSKSNLRRLKIEGEENLKTAMREGPGILLSAHFGGGFWILPFLRSRGFSAHFFSADVRKEDYPRQVPLYLYYRLRSWAVERASGRKVLFKGEGREEMRRILKQGAWIIVLLDVPPLLVKERIEATFFGKRVFFPKGIVSIAKEMNLPILPFFSYLDQGRSRRICFENPVRVKREKECVESLVRLIEGRILERPDHWHFWPLVDQFFTS